jgi:hypothetical protein
VIDWAKVEFISFNFHIILLFLVYLSP